MSSDGHHDDYLNYNSDSSETSIDLDAPPNVSTAASAVYIPGASLADKLRLAASKGQTYQAKQLILLGATFEPDREGRTALHYAACNNFVETVLFLISSGCDIDARDKTGYTALHRAAAQGHVEVIKVLLEASCWTDGQDEMHGNTALHEAAWNGYSQTIELLVSYGANAKLLNKTGFSALHLAAQNGHNHSSRILLYAGCNPDFKNGYGDTALHTAARYGNAGITGILIKARCNVNELNKNLDTALHIGAALKRRKIISLLLDAKINVSLRNQQNETALEVAVRKGHNVLVKLIMDHMKNRWCDEAAKKAAATDNVPAKVEDEKKKKRPFFFKKKAKIKESKDKEVAVEPIYTDVGQASVKTASTAVPAPRFNLAEFNRMEPAAGNSRLTAHELVLGFQRHQTQRQQMNAQQSIKNHCSCDANSQNFIGNGAKNCMPAFTADTMPSRPAYCNSVETSDSSLADQIEFKNRRMLQQGATVDNERQNLVAGGVNMVRQNRNRHSDKCRQRSSHRQSESRERACSCNSCNRNVAYQSRDDLISHCRAKDVVSMPPPGKIYRSKSDESLSAVSGHVSHRVRCRDGSESRKTERGSKPTHHQRDQRRDMSRKVRLESIREVPNRMSVVPDYPSKYSESHCRAPEGRSEKGEFQDDIPFVVPANVKDWLMRQEKKKLASKYSPSIIFDL